MYFLDFIQLIQITEVTGHISSEIWAEFQQACGKRPFNIKKLKEYTQEETESFTTWCSGMIQDNKFRMGTNPINNDAFVAAIEAFHSTSRVHNQATTITLAQLGFVAFKVRFITSICCIRLQTIHSLKIDFQVFNRLNEPLVTSNKGVSHGLGIENMMEQLDEEFRSIPGGWH